MNERSPVLLPDSCPFFVLGCPRSGTSLTRNLLRRLDGVYLPPDEFQVLPAFIALCENDAAPERIADYLEKTAFAGHMRGRGLWPERERIIFALGHESARDFRELVAAIAESEGLSGVRYWGDKTPENVFQLALIARLWPEARILHVLRDPRATVLSMHLAWGRSVLRGAVIWRDALRAVERAEGRFPAGHVQTLRYERLVADPEAELARLAGWLGVNFDPATLRDFSNEERWGSAAGHSGVVATPQDTWRARLTSRQVRLIEEICYDEMQRTTYPATLATGRRSPGPLRLKLTKLFDAVRILRAYARERGLRAALSYKLRQWRWSRGA